MFPEISPLLVAAHRGHLEVVHQLLSSKRTDVNCPDERGRTALLVSCAEDQNDCVRALLNCNGIDLNAKDKQNFDWTCLMWAVYRKNREIINMLLRHDRALELEYFHRDLYDTNALDMARTANLNAKSIRKIREKYFGRLFPLLVSSPLIRGLRVPMVAIAILMVYTY